MTLAKSIEAAREFISWGNDVPQSYMNHILYREMRDKLAALPDKPMTEDELLKIVVGDGKFEEWQTAYAKSIISALKSANVLFVKED